MKKLLIIMMCSLLSLTFVFSTPVIANDKEKESTSNPVKEKPEENANQMTDMQAVLLKKSSQSKTGK